MDRSAIEAIRELATTQQINSDVPAILAPSNMAVKSLEGLMDAPRRHKAAFYTHALADFIVYCENNLQQSSTIYIDTKNMKAEAIFDHGDPINPGWGNQTASLSVVKTPAYSELSEKSEKHMLPLVLIDFFNDWKNCITFADEQQEPIDYSVAINRIRRLKINASQTTESEHGNFNTNRSALESIEVTAGNDPIPAFFSMTVPAYEGFSDSIFVCSLRAITEGKNVQLKFRIEQHQEHIEAHANELRNKIKNDLDSALIYIGTHRR